MEQNFLCFRRCRRIWTRDWQWFPKCLAKESFGGRHDLAGVLGVWKVRTSRIAKIGHVCCWPRMSVFHAQRFLLLSFRSDPALVYFWDKVELSNNQITAVLPLPNQARLVDHNRVVQIPNVQLYDGGVYRCRVDRINGGSTFKTVQVMLQGISHHVLPSFLLNFPFVFF